MPVFAPLLFALFGAALAATLIILAGFFIQTLWTGQFQHLPPDYIRQIVALVLENALASAVLLGGPVFLGLHYLGRIRWWSSSLAGFVIGAVPGAVHYWPLAGHAPGTVVNKVVLRGGRLVQTVVNNAITTAGWLDYAWHVLTTALPGLVAGLVFWLIWRRLKPLLERVPTRS